MELSASTDAGPVPDAALFGAVGRLVDRAKGPEDLRAHGLELWAARRLRERGLGLPPALVEAERAAAVRELALPRLLERVRDACPGPILLVKGPEAAAHYPDPGLRQYNDVDILVAEPERAHRALQAAGFEEHDLGDLLPAHHLPPLAWSGLPRWVEVHRRLKWPPGLPPPSTEELFAVARPAVCGLDGVLALPPAHHAVTLAAHTWAHDAPLAKASQLIDIRAALGGFTSPEASAVARGWGIERVWTAVLAAAAGLLGAGPIPAALRVWARNLPAVRERTVLEYELSRVLSPFWVLPPDRAADVAWSRLSVELRPHRDETWGMKLWRSRRALARLFEPKRLHDTALHQELLAAARSAARTPKAPGDGCGPG